MAKGLIKANSKDMSHSCLIKFRGRQNERSRGEVWRLREKVPKHNEILVHVKKNVTNIRRNQLNKKFGLFL